MDRLLLLFLLLEVVSALWLSPPYKPALPYSLAYTHQQFEYAYYPNMRTSGSGWRRERGITVVHVVLFTFCLLVSFKLQ